MQKNHHTKYFSLIFFTGAVVLSLELLASRIMSPFFGVSLYIWTSILSVTLIFLAIGYQFGGWITSKISSKYYKELFLFIPFISSIFIIISSIAYPIILPNLISQNLLLGSFLGSSLLLAIPLVLMSSLNPILISIIKDEDDESSDSKSGFVLFVSTIGSVFGVIFTALVLIPNLTNFSSFILNAVFLTIYNLMVYFSIGYSSFEKLKKLFLFFNLILCIFLLFFFYFKENYLSHFTATKDKQNNEFVILYEKPSFYGNLKVVGLKLNNQNEISQYLLYQNGTKHNVITKSGESTSTFSYVLVSLSQFSTIGNALVLGLGAGIIPEKLSSMGFKIDAVDIDPITLDIAKNFFSYKPKNTNFFFEDARTYVKKCKKKYDLIIMDLFFTDGVPEHLTTKEFYENLNNCLNDNGIVLSNQLMDFSNELALNSVLSTFNDQFDNLHYFYRPGAEFANLYIFAGKKGRSKTLEGFQLKLDLIPKFIKPSVIKVLSNSNKFEEENSNDQNIFYDEKNRYSIIFAKVLEKQRKLINFHIPSRVLIN
jgi:spermidine synthase